uniref:DUF834 domain-containing protein n=1 Tax=Oryza rufipogon TaxID=4529 RepID=A0A0E0QXE1_ORYRU
MPTEETAGFGDHGVDGKASPEIKTWRRTKERVAGVELFTAKPREATAQIGDDRRGGATRLELADGGGERSRTWGVTLYWREETDFLEKREEERFLEEGST